MGVVSVGGVYVGREHKDPGEHFLANLRVERRVHGMQRLISEPTGSYLGAHEIPKMSSQLCLTHSTM